MVMCSEPLTRTPLRGFLGAYSSRIAISPGISFSAMSSSFLPHGAREMSATLKSFLSFLAILPHLDSAAFLSSPALSVFSHGRSDLVKCP